MDWTVQERPELKLVSHGRKVEKFLSLGPEIEGLVAASRLTPLIACSVVTGDLGVIFAFVERCHRETGSFHLPVGELTVTLDDVASLLHLPIIGAFHSFETLLVDEAVIMLVELLEVSGEEARDETVRCHGAYVCLSWLRDIYQRRCEARQWIVAARAYLLHLVGCTLFANKSATHVHVVHLDAFRDLAHCGSYAWGAVALVPMYDQLNEASQSTTRQIAGYLTLLQINFCWIYEHFPSVHDCVTDDGYNETSPRACQWLTTKAYMKGLPASPYQTRIDALRITDVCWMPYGDHQGVRAFDFISCFQERVVRQFGYVQTILPLPISVTLSYEDIDDRWMHFSDHLALIGQICLVPRQVSRDYMEWFFLISYPFITPTQAGIRGVGPMVAKGGPSQASDPPRHAMDACEAIAERLERVLNLRMVTSDGNVSQDTLVLTNYAYHVASKERTELKLASHGRKVEKFGRPALEIEGIMTVTGLSSFIACLLVTGDRGLLYAFAERWHEETSNFYLPIKELAIILDDVASLLHLPIIVELLEVSRKDAKDKTEQGCTLFANKSATHISVVFLDAFHDLNQFGGFSWEVAALVHMYKNLNAASKHLTKHLVGYITLLQHFPTIANIITDKDYHERKSHACRWKCRKALLVTTYRKYLDRLTPNVVYCVPYGDHYAFKEFELISLFSRHIKWDLSIIKHQPERVLRQFGYVQSIPPLPTTPSLSTKEIDYRWLQFSQYLAPVGEFCSFSG
ncbi:Protein MAIN-LIKE 1 [Glycine max]|nr:Protein MAIN-LIKE 1 [Glycine max]